MWGSGPALLLSSGQAMAAAAAWDGRIDIEETVALFSVGGGLQGKGLQM